MCFYCLQIFGPLNNISYKKKIFSNETTKWTHTPNPVMICCFFLSVIFARFYCLFVLRVWMTSEFNFFCSIAFFHNNKNCLSWPSHMHAFPNKLTQKYRIWAFILYIFDSFHERASLFFIMRTFLATTTIFYCSPLFFSLSSIFIVQSFIILILIFICVTICCWFFRRQFPLFHWWSLF